MAQIELKIVSREESGKEFSRKLRTKGFVPAVIYGKGKKSTSISIDPASLKKALVQGGGINTLLSLIEEGSKNPKRTVIVKDIQKHPVTFHYSHIDFYELDLKKTVTVKVPLHFTGKAEGLQQGGIVQPVLREVDIKCLPQNIPTNIDVDVTPLKIGDSLHLSDIKNMLQGKDFEITFANDDTVVTVSIAKEEVVAPTPAEAAAAPAAGEGATAAQSGTAGAAGTPATGTPAPDAAKKPEAGKKKEEGKK